MDNGVPSLALPLNFPQTFLPERRLLSSLLSFAEKERCGDKEAIGEETGIPTGKSTGKVEPMIYYALGMGVIVTEKDRGLWKLSLTSLGRLILREDPYLSESVTLWLLHLLLCRRKDIVEPAVGIADAWFTLFAEGPIRLGERFTQDSFANFLTERYGPKGYFKGLSSLVLRSYFEQTCFGSIKVLSTDNSKDQLHYIRSTAPPLRSHYPAYTIFFFLLWDTLFNRFDQLAIEEISNRSRCFAIMGWGMADASEWLNWLVERRIVQLDRQTGGTVVLRLLDTKTAISKLFDELL